MGNKRENTVGCRIGALLSSDDYAKRALFLGYGTYESDSVPPRGLPGFMGDLLHDAKRENPRFVMDNGNVVWGFQCWWCSEAEMQKVIAVMHENNYQIIEGSLEELISLNEDEGEIEGQ